MGRFVFLQNLDAILHANPNPPIDAKEKGILFAFNPTDRPVQKTPLFEPFIYKNDHFTKTGSGQT